MYIYALALVAGIIATIVFLILRVKKGGIYGLTAKAAASFGFIAVAVASVFVSLKDPSVLIINQSFNRWSLFIILGLVCGMLGDVWLDLKYCFVEKSDVFTFGGFAFFMAGHLFYLIAIYNTMKFNVWFTVAGVVIGGAVVLFEIFKERVLKVTYGRFKAMVCIYSGLLIYLTVVCLGALVEMRTTRSLLLFAGSLFFLISDLILSSIYFGDDKNTKGNIIANHLTYYLAQFLIASSLLYIA